MCCAGQIQVQRLEEGRRCEDHPRRGSDQICQPRRETEGDLRLREVGKRRVSDGLERSIMVEGEGCTISAWP